MSNLIQIQKGFGPGQLSVVPKTGWNGSTTNVDTLTPVRIGQLQDVNIQYQLKGKELFGQRVFPDDIGYAQGKITGKAKFAKLAGGLLNRVYFGSLTPTANGNQVVFEEPHTIPTTPFQVTITGANGVSDLGVFDPNGNQYIQIASGTPATGQYTFAYATGTATYTFATADAGNSIFISYEIGQTAYATYSFLNPVSGAGPTFSVSFAQVFNGVTYLFSFPNCRSSMFSLPTKVDDWVISDFDFEVFAPSASQVMSIAMLAGS